MKEKTCKIFANWRYFLLSIAAFVVQQLIAFTIWTLPDYEGIHMGFALSLLLGVSALAAFLAYRLGLWKGEQPGGFLKGLAYIGIGIIILFAIQIIGSNILLIEGLTTTGNQETIKNSSLPLWVLGSLVVLLAPLLEELIFRGLLLGKVFGKDSIVGLLVSSFLFALLHVPTSWGAWFIYGGMGLVFGLVYRFSGRYSYAVALHFINNLFGFLPFLLLQLL